MSVKLVVVERKTVKFYANFNQVDEIPERQRKIKLLVDYASEVTGCVPATTGKRQGQNFFTVGDIKVSNMVKEVA